MWSIPLFDKSTACSKQFQKSFFRLKQLRVPVFRFSDIYQQIQQEKQFQLVFDLTIPRL